MNDRPDAQLADLTAVSVPVLPGAPRRLARARRLAGAGSMSTAFTPTVSSCPLR